MNLPLIIFHLNDLEILYIHYYKNTLSLETKNYNKATDDFLTAIINPKQRYIEKQPNFYSWYYEC